LAPVLASACTCLLLPLNHCWAHSPFLYLSKM
jgi:hypothetical protein